MARGQSRGYNKERTTGPARAWGNKSRQVPTGETVVRSDGSSYQMMETRSTSTPAQKERLRIAAYNNAANRGADWIVHNPNAADVSMNNPRLWKDEAGHLWNMKTGKQLPHSTGHSHDVSVSNPPDWS